MTIRWCGVGAEVAEEPELDLTMPAIEAEVSIATETRTVGDPPTTQYRHYISGARIPAGQVIDVGQITIAYDDLPVQRAKNVVLVNPDTTHGGDPCYALAATGEIPAPVPTTVPANGRPAVQLVGSFTAAGVSGITQPRSVKRWYLLRADCPIDGAENVGMVGMDSARRIAYAAVATAVIRWPMPITAELETGNLEITATPPTGWTSDPTPPAMTLTIHAGQLVTDAELPIDQLGELSRAMTVVMVNPDLSE